MHGPRVRYSLQIKQVSVPGAGAPTSGMNPAMLNRQGMADLDDGRQWAGDAYDEGPVSDPAEAYAHFNGGPDVEAWLDRNDDGTLTGWVREEDQVWRYSDPEAWALDVDGAQMQRIDAAPVSPDAQDPNTVEDPAAAGAPEDPNAAQAQDQDPAAQDPTAEPDPEAEAAAATTADEDPANGGGPADPGTAEEQFENPFAIPENAEDADPDADTSELTDENGDPTDDAISAEPPVDEQLKPKADENPADPNETAAVEHEGGDPDPEEDPADTADDDLEETEDDQLFPEDDADKTKKKKATKKGKVPPQFQKKSLDVGILPGPERKPRGTVRPRRGR